MSKPLGPDDDFFADRPDEGPNFSASSPAPDVPKVDLSQPWGALVRPAPQEWFTTPAPPRKWLLNDERPDKGRGLLPLGKAGMLVAEGGAGKTQLLCQLAISVATGHPFLHFFSVQQKGRVLFLAGEEDVEEMHRRMYSGSRAGGPTPEAGSIVVLPLAGVPCAMLEQDEYRNPRETEFARWLFSYLGSEKFSLVVLDPLSRFAGLEAEKDNAQATRYLQTSEKIATLTGATVLNSHHNNKGSRDGADVTTTSSRGASALTDGSRWVATLSVHILKAKPEEGEPMTESLTLAFTKSNYARRGDPLELRRDERGALVPLDDGEAGRVARAKSGEVERKAKAAAKEAERAEREKARAATDLQLSLDAEQQRVRDRERKWELREDALVRLLWNHPEGMTTSELRSGLLAELGELSHGHDAATVDRLGPGIRIEVGAKNAKRHYLQAIAVPVRIRERLSRIGNQNA